MTLRRTFSLSFDTPLVRFHTALDSQDMTELSFPEGSFDAVCSLYAIIHVPREQHRQLLQSFHRMLKPEGLALLCMGAGDLPGGIEDDFYGARM